MKTTNSHGLIECSVPNSKPCAYATHVIIQYSSSTSLPLIIMVVDTLSLQGQVAIVTGSGRENGIGAGIARALSRNGALVALNFVSDSSVARAEALAASMRADGGKIAVIRSSVDTPEGSKFLVQETLAAFGADRIHILGKRSATK